MFEVILGLILLGLFVFLTWRRRASARRRWAVIDGSNVMYWKAGEPGFDALTECLGALRAQGYATRVVFDANAGYLLSGRYLDGSSLAKHLGVKDSHVLVVPKGAPADPYLLSLACQYRGLVVSNDRFRDWAEDYPAVREPQRFMRGGYRRGALWLKSDEARESARTAAE